MLCVLTVVSFFYVGQMDFYHIFWKWFGQNIEFFILTFRPDEQERY